MFNVSRNASEMSRFGPTKNGGYFDDNARIVLVFFLFLFLFVGFFVGQYIRNPDRMVANSVKKALNFPFVASMEGETSIKGYPVAWHRSRQNYDPRSGISAVTVPEVARDDSCPCTIDAASALKLILGSNKIKKIGRDSIFGHAACGYRGNYSAKNGKTSEFGEFEYWMDIRSYLPVRITMTYSRAEDKNSQPGNRKTSIDIRYFGWVLPAEK